MLTFHRMIQVSRDTVYMARYAPLFGPQLDAMQYAIQRVMQYDNRSGNFMHRIGLCPAPDISYALLSGIRSI